MATFLLKRTTLVIALAFAPAAFAQPATGADPAAAEGTTLNQVIEQTLLSNPEIQAKYHDFQSSLEGQSVRAPRSSRRSTRRATWAANTATTYRAWVPSNGAARATTWNCAS